MPLDKNSHILVVDDHATMRRVLCNILNEEGFFNILEAPNGAKALQELKDRKPDAEKIKLILMDWNMPEMSGVEALSQIRQDPELKAIPVIMITAEGQTANIVEAVKTGANSYIVKPFEARTVTDKIHKLFP
ncbi:response regulator [Deltaproteobacteria bacterium TL4]